MISQRGKSITLTNGVVSKATNVKKVEYKHYREDEDNARTVQKECKRIIDLKPKTCPKDFPWPDEWHWAQYSITPYQSAYLKKISKHQ